MMTGLNSKSPTAGIGGWLWVPILVLVVQAIFSVLVLYSLRHHLAPDAWRTLSTQESLYYNPEGLAVIGFNAVTNGLILISALGLMWLVFTRSKRAPDLFAAFLMSYAAILLTEQIVAAYAGMEGSIKDICYLAIAAGHAAIWITYFRKSKRVAATFADFEQQDNQSHGWYYLDENRKVGPIPEVEMARLINNGRVTKDTLVTFGETEGWIPLEQAAGMAAAGTSQRIRLAVLSVPAIAIVILGIVLVAIVHIIIPAPVMVTSDSKQSQACSSKGTYSQIDTRHTIEMMQALSGAVGKQKQRLIFRIQSRPETYAPPVFCLLSKVLFNDGKKEEGAFWFYAGQLRARYDANRCTDVSAREAVSVLNQEYGGPINQYMMKNISTLEKLIPKVIEWDAKTPHKYDHRWINLHGMGAVTASFDKTKFEAEIMIFSMPEAQWTAIASQTRADYLASFKLAMAEVKGQKAIGDGLQQEHQLSFGKLSHSLPSEIFNKPRGSLRVTNPGITEEYRFEENEDASAVLVVTKIREDYPKGDQLLEKSLVPGNQAMQKQFGREVVLLRTVSREKPRIDEIIFLNAAYDANSFPYAMGGSDLKREVESLGISIAFVQNELYIECAMHLKRGKQETKEAFIKRAQDLCIKWQKSIKAVKTK
jgi:hypothetical protein